MSRSHFPLRTAALVAAVLTLPALAGAQAAQSAEPAPHLATKANWQNLDLATDSVFGISTERAYKELLANVKPKQRVVVAVIDAGVDTKHEDLKDVIWVNPKEKPGNGKDDDKDGYVDDVNGWNFLGGPKGSIRYETLEMTRLIRNMRPKYGSVADTSKLSPAERDSLAMYNRMNNELNQKLGAAKQQYDGVKGFATVLDTIVHKIGKANPTAQDFSSYQPASAAEGQVASRVAAIMQQIPDFATFRATQLDPALEQFTEQVEYNYNLSFDPRGIVGDHPDNYGEKLYGNADVQGPNAMHGTHVAGIIGAERDNTIGIKGVADAVQIMSVRTVPDGDERDKDVANAIRFAADHGAKVVNMSFGKAYGANKAAVDEAVKYAVSKDVLLIHAAGNDAKNLDVEKNYPNRTYADGSGVAASWIEVGASGWRDDESLPAPFSNYGKTSVDVFSPGVRIYSTLPGSKYEELDGTSMATPVVVGLAALIRSRYPQLTAVQVKDIIMKSVVKVNHNVTTPGNGPSVPFSDLCISGGVVNAYNALKLAAEYK